MMEDQSVTLGVAMRILGYIGDLSMGQPGNHSARTASLACSMARVLGFDDDAVNDIARTALLRWSGCTANAAEFTELLGDDVNGREAMLSLRLGTPGRTAMPPRFFQALPSLARIHCDVASQLARQLALTPSVCDAMGRLFDPVDDELPPIVSIVVLAGDIEIFSRIYGLEAALVLIGQRAGEHYPSALERAVGPHIAGWLLALDSALITATLPADDGRQVSLEVIADVVDLKMPCMTGHSRRVADVAGRCAASLGLGHDAQSALRRAALIHGMGRAAVANAVWDTPGPLSTASWEQVRLVPYWTNGAGREVALIATEAGLASHAFERTDGSGYFRGTTSATCLLEHSILQVANAWVALKSPRPWREPLDQAGAVSLISAEAARGRFARNVVDAVIEGHALPRPPVSPTRMPRPLSTREREILQSISQGESSKSVARLLDISPSTVRTHVESIFRKLECSTRAAATLKAMQLGLI